MIWKRADPTTTKRKKPITRGPRLLVFSGFTV